MSKKEGFHEDEILSYGSSNFKYDNVFQAYGERDYINRTIDSVIKNKKVIYYIQNKSEFLVEHKEFCSENKISTYEVIHELDSEQQKEFVANLGNFI